jgi:hypothetical protein
VSIAFASRGKALASALLAALFVASLVGPAAAYKEQPAGGKYKDCHGYVLDAQEKSLKVHCIDGTPADLTFDLPITQDVLHADGTITQVKDLKKDTPVHVKFTQSWNTRKAYFIYFADPNATGDYGFKPASS